MNTVTGSIACVLLSWSMGIEATCPVLIAHRGASGERPEHTLAAYQLAIEQGADFIEPDLVPTRDGVLIARHENALAVVRLNDDQSIMSLAGEPVVIEATTNVAQKPEYRSRLTVKIIDGRTIGGWFSEDFTLAEIRTLRARERMPLVRPANAAYDDQFAVPSFADVLALANQYQVGVYPELKHYTFFMNEAMTAEGRSVRHDVVLLLIRALMAAHFEDPARLFIQSFEVEPLLRLRALARAGETPAWPLVQLAGMSDRTPYDLAARAKSGTLDGVSELFSVFGGQPRALTYRDLLAEPTKLKTSHADAVGPEYRALLADKGLAGRLQRGGLPVHAYTIRKEPEFLPENMRLTELVDELLALGVNALFTDNVPEVREVLPPCPSV